MKVLLVITHTIAIEVDDRVRADELSWALDQTYEYSDGRQYLGVEMMADAAARVADSIGASVHSTLGHRIAQKYPGVALRGYEIGNRLKPHRVGYGMTTTAKVVTDNYEVTTDA